MAITHDELLKKSNNPSLGDAVRALRAVVELHKPWTMENGDGEESLGCSCIPGLPAFLNPYPCETIQAIEKELNSGD
jgi:hypothetical protein